MGLMTFWTNILAAGWDLAIDYLDVLWPIAVLPVGMALVAFVWGMLLSLRT